MSCDQKEEKVENSLSKKYWIIAMTYFTLMFGRINVDDIISLFSGIQLAERVRSLNSFHRHLEYCGEGKMLGKVQSYCN